MRTLDVSERTCPGAALIFDLDVHAGGIADLGADDKYATWQSAGAMRARIRRQLTDHQNRVVGRRVPVQETGDKGPRPADLITVAGKGKGATA